MPDTELTSVARPGVDLYRCQAKLVWATDRTVEPHFLDVRVDARAHTVCWLVEQGTVTIENDQDTVSAKSGEWLFLSSLDATQHFSPRARVISIRFELNWLGGENVFLREHSRVLRKQDHPELEPAARSITTLLQAWGEDGSLLVGRNRIPLADNYEIEAAFYRWLAAYLRAMEAHGARMRHPQVYDERVSIAIRAIEHHPMEEKFNLGELARECALSVNQLGRLFKKQTGFTPFGYYENRRLDLARHALTATAMPVKKIAYNLGFASSPHFSNWFTDRHRQSPRAFRNNRANASQPTSAIPDG
jgi:AraC-like DNA-binding protein